MTSNGHAHIGPFQQLSANIKTRIEDRLGPITVWVGGNKTTKTARLDAIRLALTGKHPIGGTGPDLMELAAPGIESLEAVLSGPDGSTSFRYTTGKVPTPRRGGLFDEQVTDAHLEQLLPVQSMAYLIRSTGSTVGREAIIRRFGQVKDIPTPRGLTDEQQAMWTESLQAVRAANPGSASDSAALLAALSEHLRQAKLAFGRDIRGLEKTNAARVASAAEASAGTEQLPEWRAQLSRAEAFERSADLRARQAKNTTEVEQYRQEIAPFTKMDGERKAAKAAYLAACTEREAKREASRAARDACALRLRDEQKLLANGEVWIAAIERSKAGCALCGNPAFDHASCRSQIEARLSARRQSVASVEAELSALDQIATALVVEDRTAAEKEASEERTLAQASARFGEWAARLKAERTTLAAAVGDAASYTGATAAELRASIVRAEQVDANNKVLEADTRRLRDLAVQQAVAKTLEQEATTALSGFLRQTAQVAEAAVAQYLPAGFRAELDLEKAKWRMLGADGRAHPRGGMAGSESAALLVAVACAWTEGAPARFVLLDDEDLGPFEPANVAALFDALKVAVDDGLLTQVFGAWSRGHEIPDYVTKIQLGLPTPTPSATVTPSALEFAI